MHYDSELQVKKKNVCHTCHSSCHFPQVKEGSAARSPPLCVRCCRFRNPHTGPSTTCTEEDLSFVFLIAAVVQVNNTMACASSDSCSPGGGANSNSSLTGDSLVLCTVYRGRSQGGEVKSLHASRPTQLLIFTAGDPGLILENRTEGFPF